MFKESLGKLTQGRNVTDAEVTELVEAMRDDEVTDVQIAGFLVALLMKGPTVDDVAAIARAMRANWVQIQPKVEGNLTDMCGTGGGLQAVAPYGVDVISRGGGRRPPEVATAGAGVHPGGQGDATDRRAQLRDCGHADG